MSRALSEALSNAAETSVKGGLVPSIACRVMGIAGTPGLLGLGRLGMP
jgi:hypothetical protein